MGLGGRIRGHRKGCNHHRQAGKSLFYWDSRYQNTIYARLQRSLGRQPLGICCIEIDDETNRGLGHEGAATESKPAYLDQAGQSGGRRSDQLTRARLKMDAIIADQNRWGSLARPAGQKQIEGKARLSGTGGAANQDGMISYPHGGGVDTSAGCLGHKAGRRTTKRAPAIDGWLLAA